MPGQRIGSTISAAFGLLYVLINTGALPPVWGWMLRGFAIAVFAAVLVVVFRAVRSTSARRTRQPDTRPRSPFGWQYWCVVGIEAVALFGGARLLSGPLHAPQASIAWVSLVVGTHFFALAVVFVQPFFHVLGAAVTACGAAGVVLALMGADAAVIDVVAGVVPGALLLGFGWWGALRTPQVEASERHTIQEEQ